MTYTMKKILITGASGFVGLQAADKLELLNCSF